MSFARSSPLEPKYKAISKLVDRAEEKIASGLPGHSTYSPDEVAAFDEGSLAPNLKVVDALIQVGVLKKHSKRVHPETGFQAEDGFDEDFSEYVEDTRYEVVGTLVKLINEFKTELDARPYFISFVVAEAATEAKALHAILQAVGLQGFLSDDLQTGAQWKKDIIDGLKSARTGFIFETPNYHVRDRCKIERDFLVASGVRLIRVGLCDRSDLKEVPGWLGNYVQHEVFKNAAGFQLNNNLLGRSLPARLALDVRKRGGLQLLDAITPGQMAELASKLGLEEELGEKVKGQRSDLGNLVFRSGVRADDFCREFDLLSIF